MPIANAFCYDDRAWVMSDTAGEFEGKRLELAKIHYVAHSNLIVIGSGQAGVLAELARWLQLMPISFDGVGARWPELLIEAQKVARYRDPGYEGGQRVAVVGWSLEAGRPMLHAAFQDRSGDEYQTKLHRSFVTPWEEWMQLPEVLDQKHVQAFARQQVAAGNAMGSRAFGGRLILAELCRETCYFKSLPL